MRKAVYLIISVLYVVTTAYCGFALGRCMQMKKAPDVKVIFNPHFDATNMIVMDTFTYEQYKNNTNTSLFIQSRNSILKNNKDEMIKTPETAVRIASAFSNFVYDQYGKLRVEYSVRQTDSLWMVNEHVPHGFGGFDFFIDKYSGKIISMVRYK